MRVRELKVALEAASAEALRPLAALIAPGEAASLTGRLGLSVQVGSNPTRPQRLEGLERYPDARRLVLPVGGQGLGVVLLRETRSGRRLEGWSTAGGQALLIEPGVWHVPPWRLGAGTVFEAFETSGPSDRVDHRSLEDLIGIAAAYLDPPETPEASAVDARRRLAVPDPADPAVPERDAPSQTVPPGGRSERPASPSPTLSAAPRALPRSQPTEPTLPLSIERELTARLALGALVFEGLRTGPAPIALLDELAALGRADDLPKRRVHALAYASAIGIEDPHVTLRSRALRGMKSGLLPPSAVEAALWRVAVARDTDLIAASIDDVRRPYRFRRGRAWETAVLPSGHESPLEGRLLFESADRLLATEGGALAAGRIHGRTETIAVLVLLPRGLPAEAAQHRVKEVGRELADLGRGRLLFAGYRS